MTNLIMSLSCHVTGLASVFTAMLWKLAVVRSAGLKIISLHVAVG
jgi:hypothetical protein